MSVPEEQISDPVLTALVATPEYANIGVLMRATLDMTGAELTRELNRMVVTAKDNREHLDND